MPQVPLGCARYSVQLSKPLGIVLEEDKSGSIFVVRPAVTASSASAQVAGLESYWSNGD